MGILNVTTDSFSDGGRYYTFDNAINQALKMAAEGADIIDVGGESTRPGAQPVSFDEECDRVIPIIERLKSEIDIPISIDTRHSKVMEAALKAGASIVNDVMALQNEGSIDVVAANRVPVCLMHMQGLPQTMQANPIYHDVVKDIYTFFEKRITECEQHGIARENIWIDPGFGFGKTLEHNLTLLGNLSYFKTLGCPLLIGLSRKSMFGAILNKPPEERLYASLAGTLLAAMQDAAVIRTHDVAPTKDVLLVLQATMPFWNKTEYQ